MHKVNAIEAKNESNQEPTSNQSTAEQMEKIIEIQPTNAPIKIDVVKLLEHGDSPTAIILSMAAFTSVLLRSLKREITEQ